MTFTTLTLIGVTGMLVILKLAIFAFVVVAARSLMPKSNWMPARSPVSGIPLRKKLIGR